MTQIGLPDSAWEDVEAGTEALVDRWWVAEGDRVKAGSPLADVVLVKTSFPLVAPHDGVVEKILVASGETFPKGAAIATLSQG